MHLPRTLSLCLLAAFLASAPGFAQAGGFGFGAEADKAAPVALGISGSVGIGSVVYLSDLSLPGSIDLGELASASLNLSMSGTYAASSLKLRLSKARFEMDPGSVIDEAMVGLYLGPVSLESGLLKLTWGRADSGGPLDVFNPLDLRDQAITNSLEKKLAVPMLHARLALGGNSNIDAAFVPGFRGDALETSGKWALAVIKALPSGYSPSVLAADLAPVWTLDHSQAGARFTTIAGGVDLGLQYFYGYQHEPVIYYVNPATPTVEYNRYHQVGLDFAAVFGGFSLRGEAAANLTADLAGTDPSVPNPAIAFSLGFDRSIFADISLNLQYAGFCRLAAGGISLANDVEYGKGPLSSTLTGALAKTLLKGALTLTFSAAWGIEDSDYLLSPSAVLNFGDGEMGLYGGFFGGNATGSLGQYANASFLRAGIMYKF